jgi:L-lactate dehydrogenase
MRDEGQTGPRVVVIGTGAVGSTFAYSLMASGLAREIILVDADRDRAEGEALDLNHCLAFVPPAHIRAGGYADCAGARAIVVTAGVRQSPGESRLDLAARNVEVVRSVLDAALQHTRSAVVVVVTNPVDVLTYDAVRHSGLPWRQVIGSGTVLDSARFRYLISEHCRVDPRNVHAYVLGEHGDSEVAAWSMTRLGGTPLERVCEVCRRCDGEVERARIVEEVRRSAYHVIEAKGATYYGVSQALLRIVGAVLRDEHSILTVSTLLDGYLGISDVCMSVPCVVGAGGVERQLEADLSEAEVAGLRASAARLREAQRSVGG